MASDPVPRKKLQSSELSAAAILCQDGYLSTISPELTLNREIQQYLRFQINSALLALENLTHTYITVLV